MTKNLTKLLFKFRDFNKLPGTFATLAIILIVASCGDDVRRSPSGPIEGPPVRPTASTKFDLKTAQEMLQLGKENQGGAIPQDPTDRWVPIGGLVQSSQDYDCAQDKLSSIDEDTEAKFFWDENTEDIAISFRGSENLAGLFADLSAYPADFDIYDYGTGGSVSVSTVESSVHVGFACFYLSVKAKLKSRLIIEITNRVSDRSKARVYFTGHSLGGALALLAGLDLSDWLVDSLGYSRNNIIVYPTAAPRTLKTNLYSVYKNRLANSWEVASKWDIVTHVLDTYTHTYHMAVLNTPTGLLPWKRDKARIDKGEGLDYDDCDLINPGEPNLSYHEIEQYEMLLHNVYDPGIPKIWLTVRNGEMSMHWKGDVAGPCDRVALYRGNPFKGGEVVIGLSTVKAVLSKSSGDVNTPINKGPRYYIGYLNSFSKIVKAVKYEPHIPKMRLSKANVGLLSYIRVHWKVDDEGKNDFVAIYDHDPRKSGTVDDHLFGSKRNVYIDTDDKWLSNRFWSTSPLWIAYVTRESPPYSQSKILRVIKH